MSSSFVIAKQRTKQKTIYLNRRKQCLNSILHSITQCFLSQGLWLGSRVDTSSTRLHGVVRAGPRTNRLWVSEVYTTPRWSVLLWLPVATTRDLGIYCTTMGGTLHVYFQLLDSLVSPYYPTSCLPLCTEARTHLFETLKELWTNPNGETINSLKLPLKAF